MTHKENYNKMQYPPVIEKRTAVGTMRDAFTQMHNVAMIAVLCNGVTVAQFLSESEADAYIDQRWPNRKRHSFDNWTKKS